MFSQKQSIGIEVTEERLDLVHLAGGGKKIKMIKTLSRPVPSFKTDYRDFKNSVSGLTQEFAGLDNKRIKIIIGLPRKEIFFRHITIPTVEEADLRQVLEFEIERHIPFPAEEIFFDFQVQERTKESTTLLIVVIRREVLLKITLAFDEAGVKYHAIDINSFSIYGLLHYYYGQQGITNEDLLSVEVWSRGIEFNLIEKGRLINSREIPHNLSPMANTGFITIDKEDSLEKKREENELRLLNMISSEITAMVYDTASRSLLNNPDTGIFLFGDPKICLKMQKILKTLLGREALVFDPVKQIGIETPPQRRSEPMHSSTIGLGLSGLVDFPLKFNLVPVDEKKKIINVERYLMAVLAIIALVLGGINLNNQFENQNQLYEYIHQELETSRPRAIEAEKYIRSYKILKEEVKIIEEIKSGRLEVLSLIKEITAQFPEDTWLTNLNIDKNELEITGYALVASTLIPILENSELFEKVQFTSPITSRERNKERFKIKAIIEGKEILTKRQVKRRGKRKKRKKKRK